MNIRKSNIGASQDATTGQSVVKGKEQGQEQNNAVTDTTDKVSIGKDKKDKFWQRVIDGTLFNVEYNPKRKYPLKDRIKAGTMGALKIAALSVKHPKECLPKVALAGLLGVVTTQSLYGFPAFLALMPVVGAAIYFVNPGYDYEPEFNV